MENTYVLTGGPCSGKTTCLEELSRQGFITIEEAARTILELGDYEDAEDLEKKIFQLQLWNEELWDEYTVATSRLRKEVKFLDRSVIDTIAYCKHHLGFVPDWLDEDWSGRYEEVFVLDLLPFQDDGVRVEMSVEEAEIVHNIIIEVYEEQGYTPRPIPVIPLKERVDVIKGFVGL